MKSLPGPVERLIDHFAKLPGIGPKSAARIVFQLVHAPAEYVSDFADSLVSIKRDIAFCRECHNITDQGTDTCAVCSNPSRDHSEILVVEDILDLFAFERTGSYKGIYHVLGGLISPVEGIGPEQLNIGTLVARVKRLVSDSTVELVIATNPNLEGEATGMYLKEELEGIAGVSITRLARGLPSGADLDYADSTTLERALSGRSGF
ncbi:MAG: Recombination protein RecR [candidate division WS6 bacterium OLB20]|uniref:Recombination protein RecR n=1 Tax=candidate division WS6 bacterium OLB20 TaxID=1617426 RepID=A0A136LYC1_9BACT|nr:MAG: Recombination protein RecR [candidate division WS6 bacterium OLB20]